MRIPLILLTLAMPLPALADMVEDGAALYAASCARCHGNDGSGGRKGGAILNATADQIAAAHVGQLRGFTPSDVELAALAAFLAPLQME